MRLEDKVALITGGGGDIARSIANKFLLNGASVAIFDNNEGLLDEAAAELTVGGHKLRTVIGDVTEFDDLQRAVTLTEKDYGKVDILVTCAGVAKHMPIDELPQDSWQRVIDINLTGTYLSCKAVVPGMKQRKYGRIVTISSLGGRTGRPFVGVDYAASKSGIVGITMCLARELGSEGITVNTIAPGPLDGRLTKTFPPEKLEMLKYGICVDRLGCMEDVAYAALYLASDEAGWVTGEVLDVNGGLYI